MAENKSPDFIVHVTREYGEGKEAKTFWSRVGVAWKHKNGEGYNILLDAVPVDGKLVMLPPPEDKEGDAPGKSRGRP